MTKKPVPQPQDKYVLRMPDGLRDRIKAYAERQGTSMNHEIVRVLEREWPEQWAIDDRLDRLKEMMLVLKAGSSDPRIDDFVSAFKDTVEGIITGRVTGVDPDTREAVHGMWSEYQERVYEDAVEAHNAEYDLEEDRTMSLIGRPEKYALPPPQRPNSTRNKLDLFDVLPPRSLEILAETLAKGDLEAAAKAVLEMPRDEIQKRIEFLKLPVLEQYRRHGEEPPADPSGDPFDE